MKVAGGRRKPKPAPPPYEHDAQADMVRIIKICVRPVDVRAIPNGAHVTKAQAKKLKAEGMEAGTPDLWVCWPGGGGWLEVKRAGHTTSDVSAPQRATHKRWAGWGHRVAIVSSAEEALTVLRSWGAPVVGRIWPGNARVAA